jgi:hypothetical protein
MNKQEAIAALRQVSGASQRLKKGDFDLLDDVANKRTKIAEYEVGYPVAFREASVRLMFTVHEQKITNGTAGETETFGLANNLIDTANTTDLVLFETGDRVQPDSIDHANDSFDYTDDGTNNDLDVFYVARDPVQIEIEKSAPRAQGNVGEIVFDDATSMLHERNQNKEPPEMEFDRELEPVVPSDWTIDIYADGPIAISWADDANDVEAVNAVVSLPINRSGRTIPGLSKAVKQDIIDDA